MATLTHEFVQFNKEEGLRESDITITVEYNPDTEEIEEVKVACYNYFKGVWTDVTEIFDMNFNLDKIVSEIDWAEKYAETENIPLENNEQ